MNQNNSKILALATIIIWILGQLGCIFLHPELGLYSRTGFIFVQAFTMALAIVSFVVNIENTFETNEDWKTYFSVASIGLSVTFAWIYIQQGLH